MHEDTLSITSRIRGINYMQKTYFGEKPNFDTLTKYVPQVFFGSTLLIPNTGRFEGFKSSGQIANIKDAELANQVVDYYQEDIPSLLWVSQSHNKFTEEQFQPYINRTLQQPTSLADSNAARMNIVKMLKDPEFFNLLVRYKLNAEVIVGRYRTAIDKSKKIIEKIEAGR